MEAQETWSPSQERVGSASDLGALEVLEINREFIFAEDK
jgi:hypothetical protein